MANLFDAFGRMATNHADVSIHDLFVRFIADSDEKDLPFIYENWNKFSSRNERTV